MSECLVRIVQQPRYIVTWYGIPPYVCGCIEQMLQQANHVRSFKPEQSLRKVVSLLADQESVPGAPETVEDVLYALHGQSVGHQGIAMESQGTHMVPPCSGTSRVRARGETSC